LGRLPGVAGITYLGQRDYSLRAWLDPDKMAARNLSAMDVVTAIAQQNVQVAAGQIGQQPCAAGPAISVDHQHPGADSPIRRSFRTSFSRRHRAIPCSLRPPMGRPRTRPGPGGNSQMNSQGGTGSSQGGPVPQTTGIVRLRDVARVERGSQQYDQSCTLDGCRPLALFHLPVARGSNALKTADGVYSKMKELKTRFPDGVDYKIVYDTTPFIRESVNEVFHTLRDAVILVAIVVLVFLQDWKAMILPMIDVPVSLIGTFAIMGGHGLHAEQT